MRCRRIAGVLTLGVVLAMTACGTDGEPERSGPAAPTASLTASTTPPAPEQPSPPSPVVPEHGGTSWAVYLAVGKGPELEDAIAYLTEERGIELPGPTDIDCDQGAAEALGPDAGPLGVAVYFETEEGARAWADTLPSPPVGIAEVRTFCLD